MGQFIGFHFLISVLKPSNVSLFLAFAEIEFRSTDPQQPKEFFCCYYYHYHHHYYYYYLLLLSIFLPLTKNVLHSFRQKKANLSQPKEEKS